MLTMRQIDQLLAELKRKTDAEFREAVFVDPKEFLLSFLMKANGKKQ